MNRLRANVAPPFHEDAPWLLASVALIVTWALTSATLNLPDLCRSESLLRCSSSNYNQVHPWLTVLVLIGLLNGFFIVGSLPFAGWFTLGYVVVAAAAARIVKYSMLYVSDVIDATREALGVLFSGHNPYLHLFMTTRPMYSPFPYLPGELLFYGIPYAVFHSIDNVDRYIGVATGVLLAALAPIIGTGRASLCVALYATFNLSASTGVDGTNDGGLAFLLIASAVLLRWSEFARERGFSSRVASVCFYASACFLAWTLLYKAFSWPFLPFIAMYLFRTDRDRVGRYLLTIGGICLVAVVPFLFPSPMGIVANVYKGFVFHQYFYGMNVWTALQNSGVRIDPGKPVVSYLYIIGVIWVFIELLARPIRNLGTALLCGVAVIATALLLAHFSTSSYYAFIASVFIAASALVPIRIREYGEK
jgi:hypothetical protein